MSMTHTLRRLVFALLSTCTLSIVFVAAPAVLATTALAQTQVSAEFQSALEPYGEWVRHPRWGTVWVPDDRPAGWRPYTEGHWVYTDEWGWYWISDDEEADWGWVTYHYGRWVLDRGMGWVWVPGDEWAPAWVDWRRGGDYVGWAPAPPDDVITEYDDTPTWWTFVSPRYMTAPRLRSYIVPPRRTTVIIRQTVIVNRTVTVQQAGQQRRRFAVNPGIAPNIVAAISHQPVRTFRVAPRVLPVTQGVQGAVTVQPQALKPGAHNAPKGARHPAPNPAVRASVQPTNETVAPAASVPKPQALPKTERGRLGDRPPHAAQGAQQAPPPAPGAAPNVAPQQQRQAPHPAPNGRPTPPPAAGQRPSAPAVKPSTLVPAQPAPQAQPQHLPQPQTPPHANTRPPPVTHAPSPPPPPPTKPPAPPTARPPAPPAVARPAAPPPPAIQRAPPPQVHPAPPPVARPAPPPPQAHPAPAARPAPPPKPSEKKPAPKPGEKPPEEKK
ncbi:MAG TPA: DUF6600 domain-containing protein [Pseudolabrys sp.]|jgi:hypothetical protein|nr:DUF6600 domain-containing protein [Pseudolabrys sp.]